MHAWEAIQKTLDYIEENISDEIQIEDLAKISSLSLFYYQRLFAKLVKKPVREYIKLRRIARSCDDLKIKGARIADIAFKYGFMNHETFTRAFKESYGFVPKEYRDNPVKLNHFHRPDLLLNYIMIDEGVPLISDGLVLEINRKTLETPITFIGVDGHVLFEKEMPSGDRTGVDVPGKIWERFYSESHKMPLIPGGRRLCVIHDDDLSDDGFTYFAGAEAEQGAGSDEFITWTMPAQMYAVCGFEAETYEELYARAHAKAYYFTGTWIEKHGLIGGDFQAGINYGGDEIYLEWWFPIAREVKHAF